MGLLLADMDLYGAWCPSVLARGQYREHAVTPDLGSRRYRSFTSAAIRGMESAALGDSCHAMGTLRVAIRAFPVRLYQVTAMPLSQGVTRIYPLTVAVPAGTPIANPVIVPWVTEDAVIADIEIQIPSGPNGTTGIRIMKGDVQLLPWGASSWIIGNDYNRTFPIGGYLPTSDIKVEAYNIGQNNHTFYLRMAVSSLNATAAGNSATEQDVIDLGTPQGSSDPLSPEVILGTAAVSGLIDGSLTPGDVVPIPPDLITPSSTDNSPPPFTQ